MRRPIRAALAALVATVAGLAVLVPAAPALAGTVQPGKFAGATHVAFGTAGSTMNPGQYIMSPNGKMALLMQTDGNLVLYGPSPCPPEPVICRGPYNWWATNTAGQPGDYVTMQTDGNLVVYRPDRSVAWASNTAGSGVTGLTLTDTGALYLRLVNGSSYKGLWAMGLDNTSQSYNTPMYGGSELTTDTYASSPSGVYHLMQQQDGNLVLYGPANDVLWAAGTHQNTIGESTRYMIMQDDGNLVVYDGTTAVWASNTSGHPGAYLRVQDDGNLVVYSSAGQALWNTQTAGQI